MAMRILQGHGGTVPRCGAAPAATFATPEPWPGRVVTALRCRESSPYKDSSRLSWSRSRCSLSGLGSYRLLLYTAVVPPGSHGGERMGPCDLIPMTEMLCEGTDTLDL